MRKGEVVNLTWDKVDLKNRVISLDAADTKDREARRIPICDALHKILEKIPKSIHKEEIHKNRDFLFKGKPVKDIRTTLPGLAVTPGYLMAGERKTALSSMTPGIVSIPT